MEEYISGRFGSERGYHCGIRKDRGERNRRGEASERRRVKAGERSISFITVEFVPLILYIFLCNSNGGDSK